MTVIMPLLQEPRKTDKFSIKWKFWAFFCLSLTGVLRVYGRMAGYFPGYSIQVPGLWLPVASYQYPAF